MSLVVPAVRWPDLLVKAAVLVAVLVTVLSVQVVDAPQSHASGGRDTTKFAIGTSAAGTSHAAVNATLRRDRRVIATASRRLPWFACTPRMRVTCEVLKKIWLPVGRGVWRQVVSKAWLRPQTWAACFYGAARAIVQLGPIANAMVATMYGRRRLIGVAIQGCLGRI